MNKIEKEILSKIVDVEKVVSERPDLIDFSALHFQDRITLLGENPKTYQKIFSLDSFSTRQKFWACLNGTKEMRSVFKFSDEELLNLSDTEYVGLLNVNFKKHISKERYEKLGKSAQNDIFIMNPKWVVENGSRLPRFTKSTLNSLKAPFIDEHITDFSEYSTGAEFWIKMIKYNAKYKKIFLDNNKYLTTKSDVRWVVYKFPDIVKMLDADILQNSKLTTKEWIFVINEAFAKHPVIFKTWKFSDEMVEVFKLELTAEMLTGKSKLTKRFKNAMDKVFTEDDDNVEVEIEVEEDNKAKDNVIVINI